MAENKTLESIIIGGLFVITASVVLYHTPEQELENLIKSYAPAKDRRLFIIDNSSEKTILPGIAAEDPYVEYVFNGKNLGYGRAHNFGLQKAMELGADYHLVLNPDLRFDPAVLDRLAEYADGHAEVVYMLPQIVNEEGELQHLCKLLPTPSNLIFRRFFPNTKRARERNDQYTLVQSGYDQIIDPPCLSGCFMFLRVKALKENDLFFDERFFLYCEDFDLIRRLHRIGKTIYYPECTVIHKEEKASYKNLKMLWIHCVSACRYFNKYGWIHDAERVEMNRKILEELENME